VTTAKNLQSNVDGRLLWLELLKAIDSALPKDTRPADKRLETEEDIAQRPELHILGIECEFMPDIAPWQASVQRYYASSKPAAPAAAGIPAVGDATAQNAAAPVTGQTADANATPPAAPPSTPAPPSADATATATPEGGVAASNGGWIIEIKGYHLHNSIDKFKVGQEGEGEEFLKSTIIKNLELGKVNLPDARAANPSTSRFPTWESKCRSCSRTRRFVRSRFTPRHPKTRTAVRQPRGLLRSPALARPAPQVPSNSRRHSNFANIIS